MKQKELTYSLYQAQVKNKDTAVNSFMRRVLCMTTKMFEYKGLPDTIPQVELEKILQCSGNVGIANVDGKLYALQGELGGEQDGYYRPLDFIVANPWLKLTKTYRRDVDVAIIDNTPYGDSVLPVIGKYAVLYTDGLITLNMASILSRITMLISASDDKTKQSADLFLKKILDGDFSVIGENAFFKGVNLQTATGNTNNANITQLVELLQYYKASMLNDLGLNANYNMKRERLNQQEVSMNVDVLLPFVDSMLQCRVDGIAKVNELFGTNISVTLGSSWKLEHENYLSLLSGEEDLHNHSDKEDMTETEETTETEENNETSDEEESEEESEESDKDKDKDKEDETE